ncbi:hypothetical protein FVE85_0945 [Porphyridium purpureum]|uniref:Uncharacterized protein n=1 Tax=Porphyridium purpureum TaxID=35688 RepID=A0A5J4Z0T3_PORPP|nr:hypothetical protein FVE85_0945 [Porphyridium purpureum]|eukprot:POR1022..scf208_2
MRRAGLHQRSSLTSSLESTGSELGSPNVLGLNAVSVLGVPCSASLNRPFSVMNGSTTRTNAFCLVARRETKTDDKCIFEVQIFRRPHIDGFSSCRKLREQLFMAQIREPPSSTANPAWRAAAFESSDHVRECIFIGQPNRVSEQSFVDRASTTVLRHIALPCQRL